MRTDTNSRLLLAVRGSGLTQREVARRAGIGEAALSRLIRCHARPTVPTARALERVLGCRRLGLEPTKVGRPRKAARLRGLYALAVRQAVDKERRERKAKRRV